MNVSQEELQKFSSLASRWWDPHSEFKPLHDINPLRLGYIRERVALAGQKVLDVGTGGGILAESLAAQGANVTGIDLANASLAVAELHLHESGLHVDYRAIAAEDLVHEQPGAYDVVTCMEMLEHVPDPAQTVAACGALVKPGGEVFFSTLNRTMKSYWFAIVGAEYVLRMLPKGTHDHNKFIRPAELSTWCRQSGLRVLDVIGMTYNPLTDRYRLGTDVEVNYLLHARREP